MDYINSLENNTIKKIKKLKIKKYREEEQLFIAEGRKFLDFTFEPEIIVFRENYEIAREIEEKLEKFQCRKIIVSEKVFGQLTSQENSQGVIVVYPYIKGSLEKLQKNIVVLDKIGDPGNLGTIIRVADAAGFKDIILTKGSVDCYNEKVVRSSMGSILNMNILYMEEEELITFLKREGYKIEVTALDKDSVSYTEMKLTERNAIVFGSEGDGVSQNFLKMCDEKIIIPIYGIAESLNVAMACGIILYKTKEILGE
ncbi:TrmH family RNA methyltransferase [Fusobacterium sp. PH5-7]|uniref:TrmH family RNA methyltransferase n=1 Tax=Fusobacterium sp. PH5-7 TaxID=2940528 RepID=UPI002474F6E8|nr:RNA methyltransferase [Fusobacterium sp. PH5-7]MDH6456792.1 TrmH family RNA methyltransferase [Fusobacterium sp. PH5-7]